uniref:Coiled-coil domain-containing protein 166 n=1 Tax=Varanus komodoensis TaxID=61221 RepID=A0A8D2LTU3_VARKO
MAPKKTKSKDKKGLAKEQSISCQFVSEREQYLQKEYAILTEHVNTYTERVEHFQSENEFLDKEAQQIRENSKAYLAYLAKRTLKCQNAIITLNDQNRSDLAHVLKQKEELTSQYTDKEKEMRSQLIEMETKYSLMNKEVEELKPFKELVRRGLSGHLVWLPAPAGSAHIMPNMWLSNLSLNTSLMGPQPPPLKACSIAKSPLFLPLPLLHLAKLADHCSFYSLLHLN